MSLLKKYSAAVSVIALTLLIDLGFHKLCAVDTSDDPSKVGFDIKYPLTAEGTLALKADSFEHRDETLIQELMERHETEQVELSAEELEAVSKIFKEFAEAYSTKGKISPDFGKAAGYYLKAEKLGDQTAREAYYGLLDKTSFQSQNKKLTEIYLREAEKQDIEFLKKIAQVYLQKYDSGCSGRIAQCYLKIAELGDPAGKSEFYGFLKGFKKIFVCVDTAAEHLFPICLQEVGMDEYVERFLEENYRDGYFLKGVFS